MSRRKLPIGQPPLMCQVARIGLPLSYMSYSGPSTSENCRIRARSGNPKSTRFGTGQCATLEHIEDLEQELSVHLRRNGPGGLRPRFDAAVNQALCLLVSSVCRDGASAPSKTAHFVADSDVGSTAPDYFEGVARFFRYPTNDEFDEANQQQVAAMLNMSGTSTPLQLVRKLAGY